ncbi:MAG: ACT domain-containing protein [Calditrichaeota bacterium]|nr:MAG: ACT domain-containing protein [Calditrichota bacterium]MBL1207375.1 ACT domain-containing protein [Calditrichota bacterium]NOG47207.1 ACT domain-containing protein [Calditrichota bacterium]
MASLTENQIRQIAEQALKQLGDHATAANIEQVVHETVQRLSNESPQENQQKNTSLPNNNKKTDRVIVTAFGKNKIGILAGMTGCLATTKCDVIDLSQKILQEFFTIMLLVDISYSDLSFEQIKDELVKTGEEFDLKVIVQHEEIFKTMHRI